MGYLDRDYTQWKGSKRYKEWARSGHPILLRCLLCGKKSLFWNWRDEVYECLNAECRARGNSIDRLHRPHRVAYTGNRGGGYTSKRFLWGSVRWRWNNIPIRVRKLFLSLLVIVGLILVAWTGYLLFTHQTSPVRGTIIFIAGLGLWIWIISILRSYRYRRRKPSFKLVFFSLLGIALVCAFAGIEPLTSYKDSLVSSVAETVGRWQEQVAVREAEKEIERAEEEAARIVEEAESYAEIFNEYRQSCGLNSLVFTSDLNKIAELRLKEIQISYSHNSAGGYNRYLAENICMISSGSLSAQAAFNSWKSSPGHNANMLDSSYKYTGYANGGGYAVQVFTQYKTVNGEPQLPPGWYWDN